MNNIDPDLVAAAVEWAREAGALTLDYFRSTDLAVQHKQDGSPVTEADLTAELLLRDRVQAHCPDDSIIGEEGENVVGSSGRTWVMDPIDGTLAFTAGVGTYSNLLYLQDEDGPAIGVINLPALGETVWAVRGEGCRFNGEPCVVRSKNIPPEDASHSADAGSTNFAELTGSTLCISGFHTWNADRFDRVNNSGVSLRTWGDAYGYALVATGRADAMYDPLLEWWDLAAVNLVVKEAGGVVTRADGNPNVEEPTRERAYPYSAIATGDGHHESWVSLLND